MRVQTPVILQYYEVQQICILCRRKRTEHARANSAKCRSPVSAEPVGGDVGQSGAGLWLA
jgi:hypothetical protein